MDLYNLDCLNINNINIPYINIPSHLKSFDLVLGGGGFRSYYHLGFFRVIKELVKQNKIFVRNIIGTSSGAISAVYYACEIGDQEILSTYSLIKEKMKGGESLHDAAIYTLRKLLPPNAHTICSNKVRIYVSILSWTGFQSMYIDQFETFEDLILAISASINIPYLTSSSWTGTWFKGSRCYDGLFTSIIPSIKSKNHDIVQLEVATHRVLYPKRHTLHPGDSHIYLLSLRGLIETHEFFNGKINNIIRWIEPGSDFENKKKSFRLYLIIPGLMWIYAIKFGSKV